LSNYGEKFSIRSEVKIINYVDGSSFQVSWGTKINYELLMRDYIKQRLIITTKRKLVIESDSK
jgi:hypothetical protein